MDCACSIAGKVGLFQRLLFNKILVPCHHGRESSADMVTGVCAECLRSLEQIDVVDLDDYSAAAKGEIEMIALALRCITVHDAAAEALRAIDVLQNGRKRSEGTVSVLQSVSVAVESNPWFANRFKTISLITVQIAQYGQILVSCLKDIGSASVTGSAECLPT